jgi:hypothetical protein
MKGMRPAAHSELTRARRFKARRRNSNANRPAAPDFAATRADFPERRRSTVAKTPHAPKKMSVEEGRGRRGFSSRSGGAVGVPGGGGAVLSLGWTGNWRLRVTRDAEGVRLRASVGDLCAVIHPGEALRVLRVLCVLRVLLLLLRRRRRVRC